MKPIKASCSPSAVKAVSVLCVVALACAFVYLGSALGVAAMWVSHGSGILTVLKNTWFYLADSVCLALFSFGMLRLCRTGASRAVPVSFMIRILICAAEIIFSLLGGGVFSDLFGVYSFAVELCIIACMLLLTAYTQNALGRDAAVVVSVLYLLSFVYDCICFMYAFPGFKSPLFLVFGISNICVTVCLYLLTILLTVKFVRQDD